MMVQEAEYLTIREAAQHFGVAETTVRAWLRKKLIRRYRKPLDSRLYVRIAEVEQMKNAEPRPDADL